MKEVGDRLCWKLKRTGYKQPEDADGVTDLTLYVDTENWMQVGSTLKGADGRLLGEYFFRDLELNPDFKADTFTREAVAQVRRRPGSSTAPGCRAPRTAPRQGAGVADEHLGHAGGTAASFGGPLAAAGAVEFGVEKGEHNLVAVDRQDAESKAADAHRFAGRPFDGNHQLPPGRQLTPPKRLGD